MFVTSAEQRGGLLVAIITGGRPKLSQRPTRKLIPALRAAGVHDVVWVVSDKDAPDYERDDNDLAIYSADWAHEYAADHWMQPTPPEPGAFLGAFPGREWACLEAERRGCWGVLQLDDNIVRLSVAQGGGGAGSQVVDINGGAGLYADILAALALSTNGRMVGAQLDAVPEQQAILARPGFPYSMFIERVGDGREHWYGPFEDDITHAFQYGTRADGATSVVVPLTRYAKESKSKTGMRAKYNHERSVQLQRIFPESAKIGVRLTRANGQGEPRVFHTMTANAIRNPMTISDQQLYDSLRARFADLISEWRQLKHASNREKVMKRAARRE